MKQKLLISSIFGVAATVIVCGFASVSAQVRVPDIPRIPEPPRMPPPIPREPNIPNGPTIQYTPPLETPEPPHGHPHHGGHVEPATPQPTMSPAITPR